MSTFEAVVKIVCVVGSIVSAVVALMAAVDGQWAKAAYWIGLAIWVGRD